MNDLIAMPVTVLKAIKSMAPLTGAWLETLNVKVSLDEIDKSNKVYKIVGYILPLSISMKDGRPGKITTLAAERDIGPESDFYVREVLKFH